MINKIDLPGADPDAVKEQLLTMFDVDPDDVAAISAKLGIGVANLLDKVVEGVPPPKTLGSEAPLRILLFDSWFNRWQGAVLLVQVADGVLRVGQVGERKRPNLFNSLFAGYHLVQNWERVQSRRGWSSYSHSSSLSSSVSRPGMQLI